MNFCIQERCFWHHRRYINNILTVGMVPALFPDDEKEPLVGAIRARHGTVILVLKTLPDCSPVSTFRARGEGVSETGMWAYACGAIYSAWAQCTMDPLQTKWQSMAKCRLFDFAFELSLIFTLYKLFGRWSETTCILFLQCHQLVRSSVGILVPLKLLFRLLGLLEIVGVETGTRCRNFPGMVAGCTIDTWQPEIASCAQFLSSLLLFAP